jgi:hypothetical protein
MTWKVTLSRVEVDDEEYSLDDEEYSLHDSVMEAVGAAGQLEKDLGLLDVPELLITVKQHPETGELLMISVTEVEGD